MKRQNKFIIALLAAGITFATLTATMGTDHWKRGYFRHHHGYYHHHDHSDHDHDSRQDDDGNNSGTKKDEGNSES
jgi:hypothetical protein